MRRRPPPTPSRWPSRHEPSSRRTAAQAAPRPDRRQSKCDPSHRGGYTPARRRHAAAWYSSRPAGGRGKPVRIRCGPAAVRAFARRAERQPLANGPGRSSRAARDIPGSAPEPEDLPPRDAHIRPLEDRRTRWRPTAYVISSPLLAALVALAATMAPPAWATAIRVEGPKRHRVPGHRPPVRRARSRTTTAPRTPPRRHTALGALVTGVARRSRSRSAGLVGRLRRRLERLLPDRRSTGVTPPVTAFWAVKVGQTLTDVGLGATTVGPREPGAGLLHDVRPGTFATKPTLGIAASPATIEAGRSVVIAWPSSTTPGTGDTAQRFLGVGDGVGVRANADRRSPRVRLGAPGLYRVRATKEGAIRSKTLWVRATSVALLALVVAPAAAARRRSGLPPGRRRPP